MVNIVPQKLNMDFWEYNGFVKEARCIRFFKSREKAEIAKKIVERGGFECNITEDKFEKLTLEELGMQSRFRLNVERTDVFKVAEFLKTKLNMG